MCNSKLQHHLRNREDYRRIVTYSIRALRRHRHLSASTGRIRTTIPTSPCDPIFTPVRPASQSGKDERMSGALLSRHEHATLGYKPGLGARSMAAAEAAVLSSSLDTGTAPVPETAGTAAATAATPPVSAAAAAVAAAARTRSEARGSKAALATKLLSLSGVFAVHKPKGPTSAELLNRLKEKLLAGTAARVGTGLRQPPRGPRRARWAYRALRTRAMKGREREQDP